MSLSMGYLSKLEYQWNQSCISPEFWDSLFPQIHGDSHHSSDLLKLFVCMDKPLQATYNMA